MDLLSSTCLDGKVPSQRTGSLKQDYFIYSWKVLRGECSTNCGTGVARQNISCVVSGRYRATEEVDMAHCIKRSEIGPKPAERVVCYGKCRDTQWKYTEWSKVCVWA